MAYTPRNFTFLTFVCPTCDGIFFVGTHELISECPSAQPSADDWFPDLDKIVRV